MWHLFKNKMSSPVPYSETDFEICLRTDWRAMADPTSCCLAPAFPSLVCTWGLSIKYSRVTETHI
jgi:hypothetical protein